MNISLDITAGQHKEILALLTLYLPGVEVWAFGSRVKWSSRPDSDLDIVAFSNSEQKKNIAALEEGFMDSSLPFRIDLHVWEELPESFRKNIKTGYVILQDDNPAMRTLVMAGGPILKALDDKIKINRRMNHTLTEMARAIFNSWFVNFDPVRRNAAAIRNEPSDIHPSSANEKGDEAAVKEIDRLFPDSFQDSELGKIPKGWHIVSIADFVSLNPENLSKESSPPGLIKYIDLSNIKLGNITSVKCYMQQDAPARAHRVLLPGDTVIGTVWPGNYSYALVLTDGLIGSTKFTVLRPIKTENAQFIYLGITTPGNIEKFLNSKYNVNYSAKIIRPSDNVLALFATITNPMFAKMVQNQQQTFTLEELRARLLPKTDSSCFLE